MIQAPGWLPDLVCLEDHGGDWGRYIEAVYAFFKSDFVATTPMFKGNPVRITKHPSLDGKECAFWHVTSEGNIEDARTPDIRRCERIRWPRPIIEHHDCSAVRCWSNKRGNNNRIVVWLYEQDFVVILVKRREYVLLLTAYPVSYNHTRRKLSAEYEECQKRQKPPP